LSALRVFGQLLWLDGSGDRRIVVAVVVAIYFYARYRVYARVYLLLLFF